MLQRCPDLHIIFYKPKHASLLATDHHFNMFSKENENNDEKLSVPLIGSLYMYMVLLAANHCKSLLRKT